MNITYVQGTIRAAVESGSYAWPVYHADCPVDNTMIKALHDNMPFDPANYTVPDHEKLTYNTTNGVVKVDGREVTPYDDMTDEHEEVKAFAQIIYDNGGKELYDALQDQEDDT